MDGHLMFHIHLGLQHSRLEKCPQLWESNLEALMKIKLFIDETVDQSMMFHIKHNKTLEHIVRSTSVHHRITAFQFKKIIEHQVFNAI